MTTARFTSRRGTIFVTAMWVTIIIGAVVLVFARSMRIELTAAANRVSASQADAAELAAEQYVMAMVDNTDGEADYIMNLPGEQCRVGDAYFWLLRPAANEQNYEFGITDEASKLNINVAAKATTGTGSSAQLLALLDITTEQADSITDWVKPASQNITGGDGAQSDYYQALPDPYQAKNADLETVEELSLVKAVDNTLLFGIDRNRNGVIEPGEALAGSLPTNSNNVSSNRGIFPFVTVYSADPQMSLDGTAKQVNCFKAPGSPLPANLQQQLTTALGQTNSRLVQPLYRAITSARTVGSVFDLVNQGGLSEADLGTIADRLCFNPPGVKAPVKGLINVNTASREVLMTLTGMTTLTQNDIDNLISERDRADTSTIMWVYDALQQAKASAIGLYITNRSFVYSADIVAVSGDGRAFKRVRIVIDAQKSPPSILYRKDLTALGWPLPEDVRTSMRQGKGPGQSLVGGSGGMGGLGGGGGGLGR